MKIARIFLIVLLLAGAILACIGTGGGDSTTAGDVPSAYDVTATFGADQFFAQLTAIAKDGNP